MKAIEYVREVAEIIQTPDGPVTASALMERFLFDGTMQWSKIGKLSGGERRRLYLLRILMQAPNVLIFDEPTNDLDIQTLSILEDYLDSFDGIVVAVSHDRYFLDRVVNRIFAFEGEGHVQQYEGGYVDYLRSRALRYPEKYTEDGGLKQSQIFGGGAVTDKKPAQKTAEGNVAEKNINSKNWKRSSDQNVSKKLKFTYNEQREYDTIDADIAALEEKLENLDARILQNATNSLKLQELTKEQEEVSRRLEEKMERWMYLTELAEKIAAQNN